MPAPSSILAPTFLAVPELRFFIHDRTLFAMMSRISYNVASKAMFPFKPQSRPRCDSTFLMVFLIQATQYRDTLRIADQALGTHPRPGRHSQRVGRR